MLNDTQRVRHDLPIPMELAYRHGLKLISHHAVPHELEMTAGPEDVSHSCPRLALHEILEVTTLHGF